MYAMKEFEKWFLEKIYRKKRKVQAVVAHMLGDITTQYQESVKCSTKFSFQKALKRQNRICKKQNLMGRVSK